MLRSARWTACVLVAEALFMIALVSSNSMAQSALSPPPAETTPPGYLMSFPKIGQDLGQTLKNDGIYLRAAYVNDILADIAGGNKQGTTSTGDAAFGMNLDMTTIAGVPNAAVHVMIDDRTGLNASTYAGTLFGLSGENGPSDTIRLSEFSWDQSLLQDQLRLLLGRINPTPEFAFSDISCDFVTNITCAQPFAWYVNNSGVAFPVSTWGARMTIKPTRPSYFRIGVYQDQPFQNQITEHGFDWGIQQSTGVFIPFEVGYQHGFSGARLPFKYDIGGYYDTGSYTAPPATGETDLNRRGRTALYAQAEQTVWRPDPMTDRSLTLFGGALAATGGYAIYPLSVYAGTYVRSPFVSRPKDAMGFEATYVTISKSAEGQVIGAYDSLGLVAPDHPRQAILEADYHVAVAPGLQVIPDVQYVIHPDEIGFSNPRSGVDHAFVIGVQIVINFGDALGLPQWMRMD